MGVYVGPAGFVCWPLGACMLDLNGLDLGPYGFVCWRLGVCTLVPKGLHVGPDLPGAQMRVVSFTAFVCQRGWFLTGVGVRPLN